MRARSRSKDPQQWMQRGACRTAPSSVFMSEDDGVEEAPYPTEEQEYYCNLCPVRADCLAYALEHDEWGVWGGTTSYQRRQLNRARERAVCPGCSSDALVMEGQAELCLSCGVSWTII